MLLHDYAELIKIYPELQSVNYKEFRLVMKALKQVPAEVRERIFKDLAVIPDSENFKGDFIFGIELPPKDPQPWELKTRYDARRDKETRITEIILDLYDVEFAELPTSWEAVQSKLQGMSFDITVAKLRTFKSKVGASPLQNYKKRVKKYLMELGDKIYQYPITELHTKVQRETYRPISYQVFINICKEIHILHKIPDGRRGLAH